MDPGTLLHTNGLSRTRNRVSILDTLYSARIPMSGKEICNSMSERCDISTVYRTLNSLFEKKLVQRIIIDHEVKYALASVHPEEGQQRKDHIHFKCSVCDRLFCLKENLVDDFKLPDGFIREENQFLVIGRCDKCR